MWFRKGIDPGTIIALDQPVPSQWQIVEKLNEENFQSEDDDLRSGFRLSYASTKLLCCEPNYNTKHAFIQATTLVPQELIAYQDLSKKGSSNTPKLLGFKILTQDKSGPVPGGFAVWVAWEKVPGLRLGSKTGPDAFWALDASEREEIRESFLETFRKIREIGYMPDSAALSSLVWHEESQTLYFIGFRDRNVGQFAGSVVDVKWVASYGLAIPNSNAWLKKGWNGDTSEWKR